MQKNRREFLRKAFGASAVGAAAILANAADKSTTQKGVSSGKSKKTEVLYHKTPMWEQYYKIAY